MGFFILNLSCFGPRTMLMYMTWYGVGLSEVVCMYVRDALTSRNSRYHYLYIPKTILHVVPTTSNTVVRHVASTTFPPFHASPKLIPSFPFPSPPLPFLHTPYNPLGPTLKLPRRPSLHPTHVTLLQTVLLFIRFGHWLGAMPCISAWLQRVYRICMMRSQVFAALEEGEKHVVWIM